MAKSDEAGHLADFGQVAGFECPTPFGKAACDVETMVLMVFLVGGGFWAYRQYKAVTLPPGGGLMVRPSDTIIEAGEWQADTPQPKAKLNKYLILGLCIAYILFPLDFIPDVFPVVGWGDDLAAGIIGVKALFRKA